MNKIFFRSSFCIILVVLFSIFSSFAVDDKTLNASQIDNMWSLTGWSYVKIANTNLPFVRSSFKANSSAGYSEVKTGSRLYGAYNDLIVSVFDVDFTGYKNSEDLVLNIPLYLQNVTSYSFDFYLCVTAYSGFDWYSSMDKTYNYPFTASSVKAYGYKSASNFVSGFVTNRGSQAYYRTTDKKGSLFVFRKYSLSGDVLVSDPSLKYVSLSISFPYANAFINPSTDHLYFLFGLAPDSSVFTSFDPQQQVIQDTLESINHSIDANSDETRDVKFQIEESTDKILYYVTPDQQLVIEGFNNEVNQVEDKTTDIVYGLSATDDLQDESGVSDLTDPSNILPEGFEDSQNTVNGVFERAFENTPLEIMMIISLSMALISFILFGKKGSA